MNVAKQLKSTVSKDNSVELKQNINANGFGLVNSNHSMFFLFRTVTNFSGRTWATRSKS